MPDRPLMNRQVRRHLLLALLLTLVALLAELNFVLETTGGTLFVFTMVAPVCVFLAVATLVWVGVVQYRRANRLFEVERFPPGETIIRQGEVGDCAYFLQRGEVEVLGEENGTLLAKLGPGDYFGETALLTDAPRNATVRALTEVETAVVGKRNFLNIVRLVPESGEAIMTTVRERVLKRER